MPTLAAVSRSRSLALLAVLLGCLLSMPAKAADARVELALERGRAALENDRFERALKHFEEADRRSGGASFDALVGASVAAAFTDQVDKAFAFAARARERAGTDRERALAAEAHGLALLRTGGPVPAIEAALIEALRLDSRAARESYRYLTEVYAEMGFGHLASRFLATYEAAGGDRARVRGLARELRVDLIANADYEACVDALRAAGHEIPPLGGDENAEPPLFADGGEYRPAKAIEYENPQYTDDLRLRRLEADVVMRLVVLASGETRCPTVLKATHPGFAGITVEKIRSWRFEPAILGGRPTASHFGATTRFRLQ
ncbi:MAG: energy transducer TonB [Thermoanaerobaculia bacterium]|nr:energy transducer TonB [Thermoanaerobaculia bacterium]